MKSFVVLTAVTDTFLRECKPNSRRTTRDNGRVNFVKNHSHRIKVRMYLRAEAVSYDWL